MSSLRARAFTQLATFTRSSAAAYCDSKGLLRFAAANTPRFDHDPTTFAPRGLLMEETRTNLLLRSQEFDHAAWTKVRATSAANQDWAPDGSLTADLLTEDTTVNDSHYLHQTYTKGSSSEVQYYCLSVWARPNGRNQIWLAAQGTSGSANSCTAFFDLAAASVSSLTTLGAWDNAEASVEAWPNLWCRCRLRFRVANDGQAHIGVIIGLLSGGAQSYTGNGSYGVRLWGAQLERGLFPTTYIETSASALTRAAESAVVAESIYWLNEDAGTLYAEYLPLWAGQAPADEQHVFGLDDGTTSERHNLWHSNGAPAGYSARYGVAQALLVSSSPIAFGETIRAAYAYAGNDIALAVSGGRSVLTDTVAQLTVQLSGGRIGDVVGGGAPFSGHIRKLRYYPRRIPNAELQALVA